MLYTPNAADAYMASVLWPKATAYSPVAFDWYPIATERVPDAVLELPGLSQKIGALSTFANAYIMNSIVIEAINMLVNEGIEPPIWRSGNCPGGDEWNAQFIDRFKGDIRCL